MRYRYLGLVVAVLTVGLAPIARAQDDPAKTADQKAALVAFGRVFSSPELPPSLPVTPERLAIVRQCLTETNALAAVKVFSDLSYSQSEAQMTATTKGLPKPRQSLVMKAFTDSYKAAQVKLEARIIDEMEFYYAARMTDDELRAVIDFYKSGMGYKMVHGGQNLTPEERQQSGLYILGNPAMAKFVKLNFDYMKGAQVRRQASQAMFTADFNARFCRALAGDRLTLPACAAAGAPGTPR